MAKLRLENGKLLVQDGKLSCECCGGLSDSCCANGSFFTRPTIDNSASSAMNASATYASNSEAFVSGQCVGGPICNYEQALSGTLFYSYASPGCSVDFLLTSEPVSLLIEFPCASGSSSGTNNLSIFLIWRIQEVITPISGATPRLFASSGISSTTLLAPFGSQGLGLVEEWDWSPSTNSWTNTSQTISGDVDPFATSESAVITSSISRGSAIDSFELWQYNITYALDRQRVFVDSNGCQTDDDYQLTGNISLTINYPDRLLCNPPS